MSSSTSTSRIAARIARRFAAWFIAPPLLLFGLAFAILVLSREWFTTADGLRAQVASNGVYGRAILADDHRYKVLLYHQRKPTILALGSSRTMQFREELFRPGERFMTAGGAMSSLAEGLAFVGQTFPEHRPTLTIVGVDYWWFNEGSQTVPTPPDDSKYDSYGYVLASGFSGWRRVWDHLLVRLQAPTPGLIVPPRAAAIGSRAWAYGDGFRLDGSYTAAAFLVSAGPEAVGDRDYQSTLRRVADQSHPFEGGDRVTERYLTEFRQLLAELRRHGSEVALFMPPFSPPVYQALLASPHHGVFQDVRQRMGALARELQVPFADESLMAFADRRCYSDGFHGGYSLYAMIAEGIVPPQRLNAEEMSRVRIGPDGRCRMP